MRLLKLRCSRIRENSGFSSSADPNSLEFGYGTEVSCSRIRENSGSWSSAGPNSCEFGYVADSARPQSPSMTAETNALRADRHGIIIVVTVVDRNRHGDGGGYATDDQPFAQHGQPVPLLEHPIPAVLNIQASDRLLA